MRSVVITSFVAALLLLSGCDGLFGDESSSGLADESCPKDREALSELLTQPQACTSDADCTVVGSHCSAGVCDWDCYTDSDCGFGNTCSCAGRCQVAGAPDAGPDTDLSCQRDLAVLDPPGGLERRCLRDEHCPIGARCDDITRRCTFDCTADSECDATAGEVCNCDGECVVPGAPTSDDPNLRLPTVEVAPGHMPVPSGYSWTNQTFSIRISAPEALPTGWQPRAYLEVMGVPRPFSPPPLGDTNPRDVGLANSYIVGETVTAYKGVPLSSREEGRAVSWLNTASALQLQTSLGVGTAQSTAITSRRPYSRFADFASLDFVEATVVQAVKTQTQSAAESNAPACGPSDSTRVLGEGSWVVDTSEGYAATASFAVGRCPGDVPTGDEWRVAVSVYMETTIVEGGVTRTRRIPLDYRYVSIGSQGVATPPSSILSTGMFEGVIVEQGVAAGEPMTIPVRAWATNATAEAQSSLVLFDDAKLLSATGRIVLHATQPRYFTALDAADDPWERMTAKAVWHGDAAETSERRGTFTVTWASSADHPVTFEYVLRRLGDPAHPLSGATSDLAQTPSCPGCGAGDACEPALAKCLPQIDAVTSLYTSMSFPGDMAWRTPAAFLENANGAGESRTTKAGRILCYDYPTSIPDNAYISETFLTDTVYAWGFSSDPSSGDRGCTNALVDGRLDNIQTAVGLVTSDPAIPEDVEIPIEETAADWLKVCLTDLARQPTTPGGNSNALKAVSWFGTTPGSCINLAQFVPALAWLAQSDIDTDAGFGVDRTAATLMQRLLAQWLDVHAFVASQSNQEHEAASRLVDGAPWTAVGLDELLGTLERGWDLLLDASYANALDGLERDELRYPDYRVPRPTAYWNFAASSTDLRTVDRIGDNHVTFTGAVTRLPDSGVYDGIRISGAGSADLPAQEVTLTNDVTVSVWVKLDDPGTATSWAYLVQDIGGFHVRLYQYIAGGCTGCNLGDYKLYVGNGSTGAYSDLQPNPGSSWVHIAVVRQRTNTTAPATTQQYQLFVNGQWKQTLSLVGGAGNPSPTKIGSPYAYGGFSFAIDDLAIWSAALPSADIATIHAKGRGTPSNPMPLVDALDELQELPAADADHEQPLGLPVKILETATKHAELIEVYAREKSDELYDECLAGGSFTALQTAVDRASRSLRYVRAAEIRARELYRQAGEYRCTANLDCTSQFAGSSCGAQNVCVLGGDRVFVEPEWSERHVAAAEELSAARSRAAAAIADLTRCVNPLGLRDDEVPLYFGDPIGDNSRFFAASDYMLDGWARPVATAARMYLEDARTAWLNQRNSEIQQRLSELDRERRLEEMERSFIQPVITACGITEYDSLGVLDAFDAGELSLASCYRKPGCDSDSNSGACFRGTLGAALLEIKRAHTEIYIGQEDVARAMLAWERAADTYAFMAESYADAAQAIAHYQQEAAVLRSMSHGWFSAALRSALPDDLVDVIDDTVSGCLSGGKVGCLAGFLGSDMGAAEDLEVARENLDFQLEAIQAEQSLRNYADEVYAAQLAYLAVVDAQLRNQAALEHAVFTFDQELAGSMRALSEAKAAMAREEDRTVPSVAHHYWADEKIDRFRHEFERAKRFAYVALLAVEYEFQQSMGLRSEILTAQHPDDLLEVLDTLDALRGTRTINSRRPAMNSDVLSLREDILQLADYADAPPGERSDDATRRLQSILTSPDYAMYDDDGNYLGQGIPFTLAEQGALRHRCAERVWRATATIQGDLTAVDAPGTYVFLLKRNAFASQWCTGLGDGSPYQAASTFGTNQLMPELTNSEANYAYTTAMLFPWFNVQRSQFYEEQYVEGASEELAGRGLYGEYILLFPYYGMLEPPASCQISSDPACADPFRDLARVEDVLVRFDYYSVDDLPL